MAKARKSKTEKAIEAIVDHSFKVHGSDVQFNIMDLGKISDAGISAGLAAAVAPGVTPESIKLAVETAVKAAIAQYRQN